MLSSRERITEIQLRAFAGVIQTASGIVIGPDKGALVQSRLQRIAAERGHASVRAFLADFLRDRDRLTLRLVVEALTTNHTYYWREHEQFEFFRATCLPELQASLRAASGTEIWCAAASYGQEAWTIAGLVSDCAVAPASPPRVLATDLSTEVLGVAREGWYAAHEVERLPQRFCERWFRTAGLGYRVAPFVHRDVCFDRLNLIDGAYPAAGSLSVVFCRNVLIYFDQPTRRRVYDRMRLALRPGGWLFISQTESLPSGVQGWNRVAPGIFRRT